MKTALNKNINKNNMLQELCLNPDWAKLPLFDRSGWQRLPFGAFAESVNERVDPSEAADEIYVGLEHLDPQDLHIRRWGKSSDVIGTKLRFRKGDLIFGRRRAYDLSDLVYLTRDGHEKHSKSQLKEGDVVVVRTGRPGDAAVVTKEIAGMNLIDLILVRPKEVAPQI